LIVLDRIDSKDYRCRLNLVVIRLVFVDLTEIKANLLEKKSNRNSIVTNPVNDSLKFSIKS